MMRRLALFVFAALPIAASCGVAAPSFDTPTIPYCGEKINALPAKEARVAFDEGRFHQFRALFHLGAVRKLMNPEIY